MYRKYLLTLGILLLSLWSKATIHLLFIDPFGGTVGLKNFHGYTIDFSHLRISTQGIDTPLYKLGISIGTMQVPGNNILVLTGFPMDFRKGYLSLHDTRGDTLRMDQKESLLDFVQWGDSLQGFALNADSLGYWKKNDFLNPLPVFSAYTFTGVWPDYGKKFWQVLKLPQITLRFAFVSPKSGIFGIKNPTAANVEAGSFSVCVNGTCFDSLKNSPWTIVKGKTDIPKGDTLWLSGVPLDTAGGSLALFFPMNRKDTANMMDFVQWNKPSMGFHDLAHAKGIWDSTQSALVHGTDSLAYSGDYSRIQSGATYWQSRKVYNAHEYINSLNWKTYPNPASENLMVEIPGNNISTLNLMDLSGKSAFSTILPSGNQVISLSEFPNGIYVLVVNNSITQYTQKICIQH